MTSAQSGLDALVAGGQLAGAVALVWRGGRVCRPLVSGWREVERRVPMRRDTLFRIASLTKPVTSVAALMLYEEGRFALEEPITSWAPEFRALRVLRAPDGPLDDSVPAERPITFGDLLTHRAGFTYGAFHPGPLGRAYRQALGADIDSHLTPDEWIAGLAGLPLVDQPGRAFQYGVSTDLLGFLIARMDDAPLDEVLRRRIFGPLGMLDTTFVPTATQRERSAGMYGFDAHGQLEHREAHPPHEPAFLARRPPGATFVSGSGGLWSTADDYLTFARLFVGGGAVAGVRLLSAETLRRMMTNVLTPEQIAGATMLGLPAFSGQGFGLGVAVVLDPESASVIPCRGGVGTVGWPGAYGSWWQADPTDGSVLVFLAHNALDFDKASRGLGLGVYAAIDQFHASQAAARERRDSGMPAD